MRPAEVSEIWQRVGKGVAKSVPMVGGFLEEVIFGVMEESRRRSESATLRDALGKIDSQMKIQTMTLEYVLQVVSKSAELPSELQSRLTPLIDSLRSGTLPPSLGGELERVFKSCFLSYSTKDAAFAERIYGDLIGNRVPCWFAPEDLDIGSPFRQSIYDAIRVSERLVLILSKDSVVSPWVETEVENAFEMERQSRKLMLFPLIIDDTAMDTDAAWAANIRQTRIMGDFRGWENEQVYSRGLTKVLRGLRGTLRENHS